MDGRREIVVEEVRDVSSLFRSTSAMFLVCSLPTNVVDLAVLSLKILGGLDVK
jgi:hypothetical protein